MEGRRRKMGTWLTFTASLKGPEYFYEFKVNSVILIKVREV